MEPFFEIPVKNKEEACEAITEMSKNNDIQQVIYCIMNVLYIPTN